MFNFILSYPLADGRFVIPNTELTVIKSSKLKNIEMKVITSLDPEYLKEKFTSEHRSVMEDWTKMIPRENISSEVSDSITTFARFAKERIEHHEHKFITGPMFINDLKSQMLFSRFFGGDVVNLLYKIGYFDPFDHFCIRTTDELIDAIEKSIGNSSNIFNPFEALRKSVSMLSVKNQFTEWCSAS